MCMCSKWLVIPPAGKAPRRYFTTEAQANDYAAKYPGASIKAPKKK